MININKRRKLNQNKLFGQVKKILKINQIKRQKQLEKENKIQLMIKQLFKKKENLKMNKQIGFLLEKKKKNINQIITVLQKVRTQAA